MSELHKFVFQGQPVRGMIVRLTDAWREVLRRRAANSATGAYPIPVQTMLGEMLAAATLMQGNIKFDGALVLQIFGDGPVPVAVAEVSPDLGVRGAATVNGPVPADGDLGTLVNMNGHGRCAITLDPKTRHPGQQPYQGVVPLADAGHVKFTRVSEMLAHYMRQSEQLDTCLVLAANADLAAGLLIQRLPGQGTHNLSGSLVNRDDDELGELDDAFQRIALMATSLKQEELLTLDVDTILRRLFWQEALQRFEPLEGAQGPHFACSCSRERVARMILGLGQAEAADILAERGEIEVTCEFCVAQYRFDPVDAAQVFTDASRLAPSGSTPR
ncbi:Hsp33 family molecular chaperone HslO [Rhodoferax sp.]|uniref:Hsp33 family molecular chaperone HslO n=1 Tax=Rhodoferax sp. TaxID=50421 RepID=UPI0027517F83|nr:Hsp33 family molecular chaperone HslO [Rhodoferax sp.]